MTTHIKTHMETLNTQISFCICERRRINLFALFSVRHLSTDSFYYVWLSIQQDNNLISPWTLCHLLYHVVLIFRQGFKRWDSLNFPTFFEYIIHLNWIKVSIPSKHVHYRRMAFCNRSNRIFFFPRSDTINETDSRNPRDVINLHLHCAVKLCMELL